MQKLAATISLLGLLAIVAGPAQGAAAAELPILITSWDQVGLMRVLPDYSSCR